MVLRRLLPFAIAFVVACTRAPTPNAVELPPSPSGSIGAAPTSSARHPGTSTKRCLPLVAKACGCVYDCGVGVETSPGSFQVTHPRWGTTPLTGKVETWCYQGDCTDAFSIDVVCDVKCGGKPADHGCHFEGETCTASGG